MGGGCQYDNMCLGRLAFYGAFATRAWVATSDYAEHETVLKKEVADYLCEKACGFWFADLTFGGGGHSLEILSRDPTFKVVAMDQDPEAWENAQRMVQAHSLQQRLFVEKGNFKDFAQLIAQK